VDAGGQVNSEEEDREPRLSGPALLKDPTAPCWKGRLISLHCAVVNSKPFGNNAHTGPPRSRQSLAVRFSGAGAIGGTPEAFTFTPGPRKASTDSFLN
jgi:hypothetical protein